MISVSIISITFLFVTIRKKKHIEHVKKIFKRLKKINFFLNIDKYEFFVIFVKFLDLIIIIDDVKINFQKIEIIIN